MIRGIRRDTDAPIDRFDKIIYYLRPLALGGIVRTPFAPPGSRDSSVGVVRIKQRKQNVSNGFA